ncbi:hypothetical protein M1446_05565 [Candidatus Dependentiae bacterium]|nr:hypothetical protein [Candidatus Dependentiae bacterium]
MNKQFFSYLIIISIFSNFSLIAEESKINKLKKSISALKAPAKFVGGVSAAIAAYILTDNAIYNVLPKYNSTNNNLSYLLTRPTSLMASIYFLTVAFQTLQAKLENKTFKQGIKNGLKKPFIVHQEIADKISETISKKDLNISFKNTFFLSLAYLQSVKLYVLFINGFTPISDKDAGGKKLWKKFGLKKDMSIEESDVKYAFEIFMPLILSTTYGVAKGIHSLIKDKNSNQNKS